MGRGLLEPDPCRRARGRIARGGDCKRRVAKGGAWCYEAEFARPSARMSFPKGSRLNVIGFRVARPLE